MKTAPNPPNSRMSPDADPAAHAPVDAAEESWSSQFDEASEYLGHYFAARSDLWRIRSSKLAWNLAAGIGAGVVGVSLAAVAAACLLAGIAGGLTALLGGRAWAGDLLTGILVLASAGIGFTLIRKRAESARRRRLFAKYEQRHDSQLQRYGHDMSDRAAG
nr:hypothetical protein ACD_62C00083G0012 [uncultured bacterium]